MSDTSGTTIDQSETTRAHHFTAARTLLLFGIGAGIIHTFWPFESPTAVIVALFVGAVSRLSPRVSCDGVVSSKDTEVSRRSLIVSCDGDVAKRVTEVLHGLFGLLDGT